MNDIHDYVLKELPKFKGQYVQMADECGVSYTWLRKLARNQMPNPSYSSLKRVVAVIKARK